ncbi:hypothetical protein Pmani_001289 [Petrolisthes manimaculis]|uniref:Uncharacterized protein n=1 Tax=Petrolisthes manimaculis TaxID=1843537 RepID=A0AAE1QKB3_9EUCA|nr:hypothetical protein Pmani_001289 [Petrolisthes manimaculis]
MVCCSLVLKAGEVGGSRVLIWVDLALSGSTWHVHLGTRIGTLKASASLSPATLASSTGSRYSEGGGGSDENSDDSATVMTIVMIVSTVN